MALRPLFYLLAKHGPWSHHVRIASVNYLPVLDWLSTQSYTINVDYEVLNHSIMGKYDNTTPPPIFLFNSSKIATYVKMVWG